jgi:hypothetical protein
VPTPTSSPTPDPGQDDERSLQAPKESNKDQGRYYGSDVVVFNQRRQRNVEFLVQLSGEQGTGRDEMYEGSLGAVAGAGVGVPSPGERGAIIAVYGNKEGALSWNSVDFASMASRHLFDFGDTSEQPVVGCHLDRTLIPAVVGQLGKAKVFRYQESRDGITTALVLGNTIKAPMCSPLHKGRTFLYYLLQNRGNTFSVGVDLATSAPTRARVPRLWRDPRMFVIPGNADTDPSPVLFFSRGRVPTLAVRSNKTLSWTRFALRELRTTRSVRSFAFGRLADGQVWIRLYTGSSQYFNFEFNPHTLN